MTREDNRTVFSFFPSISSSPPSFPSCFQHDSTLWPLNYPPPSFSSHLIHPPFLLHPWSSYLRGPCSPSTLTSSPSSPTTSQLYAHSPCGSVGYYSEIWSDVDSWLHEISMSIDLIWCGWLLDESLQSRAVAHLFIYLWQLCFTGFDLLFCGATAKDYKYTCTTKYALNPGAC